MISVSGIPASAAAVTKPRQAVRSIAGGIEADQPHTVLDDLADHRGNQVATASTAAGK